jgi:hypothetical protein
MIDDGLAVVQAHTFGVKDQRTEYASIAHILEAFAVGEPAHGCVCRKLVVVMCRDKPSDHLQLWGRGGGGGGGGGGGRQEEAAGV